MSLPADPKARAEVLAKAMRVIHEHQDDGEGISEDTLGVALGLDAFDVEVLTFELETFKWVSSRGRKPGRYSLTLQGMVLVSLVTVHVTVRDPWYNP